MTLSGTERASLRLALGVLRKSALDSPQPWRGDDGDGVDGDVWSDAIEILTAGGHASYLVGFHVAATLKWVDDREIRARVCLFIRAVLRAERGLWWVVESISGPPMEVSWRLARPLWLIAAEDYTWMIDGGGKRVRPKPKALARAGGGGL